MDDDWATCDAEATVTALSPRYRFSRANAVQLLRDQGILLQRAEDDDDSEDGEDEEVDEEEDDWDACDAEAVVTALSARYRFSRANAVQLLRDQGILLQRDDDDDDDEEDSENDYDSDDPYFGCGLPCTNMQEPVIIPMPEQDLITVGAIAGEDAMGFQDGAAADAKFDHVRAILHLPGGRLLLADQHNDCIRLLSADLQEVSTVAGEADESGQGEYRDGAAAQARFSGPSGLALLSDGRVLVAGGNRIRMLSADLQQVSTVAGGGYGQRDGAAAQAQFNSPSALVLLPGGRVLVADYNNNRLRLLSADLQHVSTVAGGGEEGHRDGAAAQAQFARPTDLALLPGGRVLVADFFNHRIRVLSADLQQVGTVAGDGEQGHQDGAAAQARFCYPTGLALLPDGRVLVPDHGNNCIRVLSANLQEVSTLTMWGGRPNAGGGVGAPCAFEVLPDGRVLVGCARGVQALEGFPPALVGVKPAAKVPKKLLKRAFAGGASSSSTSSSGGRGARSSGPAPKRGRSGAGASSAADASSDSDSEDEQPGGSAAAADDADPLV